MSPSAPALEAPTLDDVREARERIAGIARRTPLLPHADAGAAAELRLKLENLQPIGSFKIRGAANAMADLDRASLAEGVYTASAGNMAQGVAWCARAMGVPCRVIVPEHAPRTKTDAIERLGGVVRRLPFDDWWRTLIEHGHPEERGFFVHPFADRRVMAGNGTVALEIVEEMPEVDAILVPYGGGGLACGIAAALRHLRPEATVYAVEVETAAPLTASLSAGKAATIDYTRSFVDGMGSGGVSEEMWPVVQPLIAGTIVVSLDEVAAAVRTLVERTRVVAEGAGAAPLAAALSATAAERLRGKRVVSIISGGNIDSERLTTILRGEVP